MMSTLVKLKSQWYFCPFMTVSMSVYPSVTVKNYTVLT